MGGADRFHGVRSSTRWIVEITVVSVILLGLGLVASHSLAALSSAGTPSTLEQVLITVYLLLVGLVVELIRWARDSLEQAVNSVKRVLEDQLTGSAERAVRGAILRSIFPSGNSDPATAQMHFGIVENYLRQVEAWPPLVQRASGILVERHLAAWRDEMDDLTGSKGLPLKMDESARMSAAMVERGTKYIAIERAPCDPEESWSPGFLKLIDRLGTMPTLQKKFVLLANGQTLWDDDASEEQQRARQLYLQEETFLRRHGFDVFFCDERAVHRELGTTDIPTANFEIFSEQVALQMEPAVSYDRLLPVVVRSLTEMGELRRFLAIVEAQSQKVTSRMIRTGRLG